MKYKLWLLFMLSSIYCSPIYAGLRKDIHVMVDGVQREYDLYVPDRHTDNTYRPLVILYHGHFGSSDVMTGENGKKAPYKRWLALAERDNFLVAIPEGSKGDDGKQGWNDCRADATANPTTDDVKFTKQLIKHIQESQNIDFHRIYATGTSNGGNMVIRLAMEMPELLAAVAPVIASNPSQSECIEKKQPISILFMNGTQDPLLPYGGGRVADEKRDRGTVASIENSIQYWTDINGTSKTARVTKYPDINKRDNSTVEQYLYTDGNRRTEVALIKVINGGHTEPSRLEHYRRIYKRVVGNQNYDIEMADEVWGFFSRRFID
jgi:polyhydroxybutyrate depolymerase